MNYLIVEGFSVPTPFIFSRRLGRNDMRGQLPYGQILFGGNAELGVKARLEEDAAFIAHVLRVR